MGGIRIYIRSGGQLMLPDVSATIVDPHFHLMQDLSNDFVRPAVDNDGDRMFVRSRRFQCRKLAVAERHRHEMLLPCDYATADKIGGAVKIDERDPTAVPYDDVAIGPLRRGTGENAGVAACALERDEEKWVPVFRRNQVYADCASLSAIFRSKLLESITFMILD